MVQGAVAIFGPPRAVTALAHELSARFLAQGNNWRGGSNSCLTIVRPALYRKSQPATLFLMKKCYWLFAWLIFTQTQTAIGLLESSWYRIRFDSDSQFAKQDWNRTQKIRVRIPLFGT